MFAHFLFTPDVIITQEIPRVKKRTFNLPNFTDNKVPLGVGGSANIGRYNAGEVPNIEGSIVSSGGNLRSGGETVSGALYVSTANNAASGGSYRGYQGIYFDASRSSTVYRNNISRVIAHGVMMFYCIKY